MESDKYWASMWAVVALVAGFVLTQAAACGRLQTIENRSRVELCIKSGGTLVMDGSDLRACVAPRVPVYGLER